MSAAERLSALSSPTFLALKLHEGVHIEDLAAREGVAVSDIEARIGQDTAALVLAASAMLARQAADTTDDLNRVCSNQWSTTASTVRNLADRMKDLANAIAADTAYRIYREGL